MNLAKENESLKNIHYRTIFINRLKKEITNDGEFIDHQNDIRLDEKLSIYYLLDYNDIINFVIDYNIRGDKRITYHLLTQEILDLYLNDTIPYIIATRNEILNIINNNIKIHKSNIIGDIDNLNVIYDGEIDLFKTIKDKYDSKLVQPVPEPEVPEEEQPETP